jgi:large conductance mechanosensitive channel
MGIVKEFKEFAVKGNAMDMAVGIILGAAFGRVVNSLVADVIMPPLGMLLGGVDFKDLAVTLKDATVSAAGEAVPAVAVRYGLFISTAIDFLIIGLSMFVVVKALNKLLRAREKPAQA